MTRRSVGHYKRTATWRCAASGPSLRVAPTKRVCGVVGLGNGITIAFALRLASIALSGQRAWGVKSDRLLVRIERLASGNPGDVEPVGEGVSELRIDYGPGYRVYYKRQGHALIVLLAGGDKRTQDRDIRRALQLARELEE